MSVDIRGLGWHVWGLWARSPLKDWLKLLMATMGQSVAKVVIWECILGRQKGKEPRRRASPLLGQSLGLGHLTQHDCSEPDRS